MVRQSFHQILYGIMEKRATDEFQSIHLNDTKIEVEIFSNTSYIATSYIGVSAMKTCFLSDLHFPGTMCL